MRDGALRPLVLRGLLVAAGLGLGLGLVEIGLRLAHGRVPAVRALLYSAAAPSPYAGAASTEELLASSFFGFHPLGSTRGFRLNSRGFRSREAAVPKPPGIFRIVALGDSFTFDSSDVPFDQMWHQVLGRRLAELAGQPPGAVEVVSLGVPAVGPRFERRLWQLEGQRLAPDLVVLGFFVGNDFTDESGIAGSGIGNRLVARSYVARLLRNAWRWWREGRRSGPAAPPSIEAAAEPPATGGQEDPAYPPTYDPAVPGLPAQRYLEVERARFELVTQAGQQRFERLFAEVAPVLLGLDRDVRRSDSRLVVLLIPDEYQVDPALLALLLDEQGLERSDIDLDRPQRRLLELCADAGLTCLDLLPVFRRQAARSGGGRLYRLQDTHWSAAGNRLAGRALARFLAGTDLAPPLRATERRSEPR